MPAPIAISSEINKNNRAASQQTMDAQLRRIQSEKDPEKVLAMMYQMQMQDFNDNQKPVLDMLEAEAKDTSLIEQGERQAARLGERTRSMTDRYVSSNSNSLLPSQRIAMQKKLNRDIALGEGSIITGSRDAQRLKRVAARNNIMSIAEQLQQTGTAATSGIAAQKAQRDQAAKSANKGFMGQALSIVGGVVGGIYGGPTGAQIGASAGGMIGGSIG